MSVCIITFATCSVNVQNDGTYMYFAASTQDFQDTGTNSPPPLLPSPLLPSPLPVLSPTYLHVYGGCLAFCVPERELAAAVRGSGTAGWGGEGRGGEGGGERGGGEGRKVVCHW